MRRLSFVVALVGMLGWSMAANAGTVTQHWDIDDQWGSSGKTSVHTGFFSFRITFPANSVMGHMKVDVYDPATTFKSTVPPKSASVHVASQMMTAKGSNMGGSGSGYWKITGSVKANAASSTSCHVGSNGMIKSCNATFNVTTWAHCTGPGCQTNAPGTWPNGATSTHSQMWQAASVHLGDAQVTHTQSSNHYLKSFQVTLTPPGNHIASSNSGFHTFHLGAKQTQ